MHFLLHFRESNVFTKEITKELIWRFFLMTEEQLLSNFTFTKLKDLIRLAFFFAQSSHVVN